MNFQNSRFPKRPLELLSVQEMDELSPIGGEDERQEVELDDVLPILDISSSIPNRAKKITAGQLVKKIAEAGGFAAPERVFDTIADAEAATIPAGVNSVQVDGIDSPGDSDIMYFRRVGAEPSHGGKFQGADGTWWEDISYVDITIRIPSQIPTLQEAVDRYSRMNMRQGAIIELLIDSGHNISEPLVVRDGNYSKFVIRSDDSEVSVSGNFSGDTVIHGIRAQMPILDCLINAQRKSGLSFGYRVEDGSFGLVTQGSGVKRVAGSGLYVHGSTAFARQSIFTECGTSGGGGGGSGATCWGGFLDAQEADFSDSLGYGAQAAHGAITNYRGAKANRCGRYGFRATDGATLDCEGGEADDCGENALRAFNGCTVNASPFTGRNAGARGAVCAGASTMNIQGADLSGATDFGIHATTGGIMNADGANCQRGGSPSANDCIVTSGGQINATDLTGGMSQIANIPTNDGVIFDRNYRGMYEYGSWTCDVVPNTSGSFNVTTNVGRYVRVGRMVTVWLRVIATPQDSPQGILRITGLPFTATGIANMDYTGTCAWGTIDKSGHTQVVPTVIAGEDRIHLHTSGMGVGMSLVSAQEVGSSLSLRLTVTYLTND